MKTLIKKSVFAGLLIAFAGILYLNTENKIVGSILFGIGLISVIMFQANLFTGKIGYTKTLKDLGTNGIILISNLVTAYLIGLIYSFIYRPNNLWVNKVNTFSVSPLVTFFGAIICGICIYLAVDLYKKKESLFLIILPVCAFILAKGNHCIADCFYFGASRTFNLNSIICLLSIIAGNSIGSLLVDRLKSE